MMVTFVSQCEKKALNRTRRVLDAFADRIGERTWQTVITEEGLNAVKKLLRQSATKNTAVACHWSRSRSRSDLVWIVGNRRCFNTEGIVPVNSTRKNKLYNGWENNWTYLPIIKALVAISALLHDWGKATALFQSKLKNFTKQGDPIRHEWISCMLLCTLVQQGGGKDEGWLRLLIDGQIDEEQLQNQIRNNTSLESLPPLAQLVAWLIITHHRLPKQDDHQQFYDARKSLSAMLKSINISWGYQNKYDKKEYEKREKACFVFPEGLLSKSVNWIKQLKKWADKLLKEEATLNQLIENGSYRLVLHHARLCLMLGDHYYSSCNAAKDWQSGINLYANTDEAHKLKQKLDEHLVNVSKHALNVCQSLSRFTTEMDFAHDIRQLKQKSPAGYEWQDDAVFQIALFRNKYKAFNEKGHGFFAVNMASTGCGKTIANAKIMRVLSDDSESLRYILALGLRTLTLQTGDEYREKIGLKNDELAVLIGSSAIKELHEKSKKEQDDFLYEELGSESSEMLLEEELDYENAPIAEFLDIIFPAKNAKQAIKNKAFLYKPVLACTIDHIIGATETIRGGKYILPSLRLLSSDLVIDEVDDFDGTDLIAIGRLIHLVGMLGRKVMISSATISPALAEGFFNAYQQGWILHSVFKGAHSQLACAWIDEFNTQVQLIDKNDSAARRQDYKILHQEFIMKRVGSLKKQIIRRKAFIANCKDLLEGKIEQESIEQRYFEKIKETAIQLHKQHHTIDDKTGKKVSFGVIRMANISPCVKLSQFLLKTTWESNVAPKIMVYHSRQVLLLRHEQEKHLDHVLKRKEKPGKMPDAFNHPTIRKHLDLTVDEHVIFILVATPVEEVGRDHDFDWAVVEPSSYRSIIQLAGRVRRHRLSGIDKPNIAIMQYNLRALRKHDEPAYCRPGYENTNSLRLSSHDLCKLINEAEIQNAVTAIPRIQQSEHLNPQSNLADLEHQAMINSLNQYNKEGPQGLQGWLTESWWLTALPQQYNRFRAGRQEIILYQIWKDGKLTFHEKNEQGEFIQKEALLGIRRESIEQIDKQHFWLIRDYEEALQRECDSENNLDNDPIDRAKMMQKKSERYGEISIPADSEGAQWSYSDQFGLF